MDRFRSLTNGLSTSSKIPVVLIKRSYLSLRHKEPKKLSWQWLAKDKPELVGCKDLCFPKKCPKPSFFPRWKKHYIPAEKKACPDVKKGKMTWGEYFSYLFPEPVAKPPLVTCRKLQAERRRACTDPREYPGYCLNENCCPPLMEWYGQAIVYQVPSPFPELRPAPAVHPCVAPIKSMESGACPRKVELDMNDYAYSKPYSQICGCESVEGSSQQIKCAGPCYDNMDNIDRQPICRFFSDYKKYQPPEVSEIQPPEVPQKVCRASEEPEKPMPKEINIEPQKTLCERPSFLKPFKAGERYEGMTTCKRKMHTQVRPFFYQNIAQRTSKVGYSTLDKSKMTINLGPTEWETHSRGAPSSQPAFRLWDNPNIVRLPSFSCDIKSYGPCDPSANTASYNSYNASEIDPELLKMAEQTSKKCKYAPRSEKSEDCHPTLLQKLSDKANERYSKKVNDCNKTQPVCGRCEQTMKNKFSLCKSSTFAGRSKANFSTSAFVAAAKRGSKNDKNQEICSGCPGVRELAEEMKNPKPKPAINCKSRPAGKCRVYPKEGEELPDNPYIRNKAKSNSICNKPRPPVCKKERPYKMPCEDSRRKYHTTAFLPAQANFTPLAEIMKAHWVQKEKKNASLGIQNTWDSHTADSYFKTDGQVSESVPKKSKYSHDNPNKSLSKSIPSLSNLDDWDTSTEENFHTRIKENIQEKTKANSILNKLENASQSKTLSSVDPIIKEASPVNIWDKGHGEIFEESKPKESSEDSARPKRPYIPFQRSQSAESLGKPTKFSMLFKTSSGEVESKTRLGVSHSSRGQARDFFNPLDE